MSERPQWATGRTLWEEDECTRHDPNAERLPQAWQRLFGEVMPALEGCIAEWDGGDTFAYLLPGKRVAWHTYTGAAISLVPPDAEKTAPAKPKGVSKPAVHLFTDGACKANGNGGWAYVLRHTASGTELEGAGGVAGTTSQRMELQAALSGLQRLKASCRVRLVSDSKYVVRGINEWVRTWASKGWRKADGSPVLNVDLWQALLVELDRHVVRAEWVRGHSGHPENERCDQLAVAASEAAAQGKQAEIPST